MPTSTPPASDLCATSVDAIFSTTGKPISEASEAASAAEVASCAAVTGMPAAASSAFDSTSLSKVRPAARASAIIPAGASLLGASLIRHPRVPPGRRARPGEPGRADASIGAALPPSNSGRRDGA